MNNKSIFVVFSMLICTSLYAQQIKRIDFPASNTSDLLKDSGYELYTFDIRQMQDTTYNLTFEIREFVESCPDPVHIQNKNTYSNRVMLSAFTWKKLSSDALQELRKESYDFDKGIYSIVEHITIGFHPSRSQSIAAGIINIGGMGKSQFELKLKSLDASLPVYRYYSKPYKTCDIQQDCFIPLVMYYSSWIDSEGNIAECMEEMEICPLAASDILRKSPHYYVIGIIITH